MLVQILHTFLNWVVYLCCWIFNCFLTSLRYLDPPQIVAKSVCLNSSQCFMILDIGCFFPTGMGGLLSLEGFMIRKSFPHFPFLKFHILKYLICQGTIFWSNVSLNLSPTWNWVGTITHNTLNFLSTLGISMETKEIWRLMIETNYKFSL